MLETVLPLALAVLAVQLKGILRHAGGTSVSTLLLALVVIAFLIPQLRRYTLVVICFGVCVFAVHRTWEGIRVVDWQEAVWTDYAFILMWLGIALWSGLAGIGEVWFGSPRWSQQSYLLAVALYFIGHGGSEWLQGKRAPALFLLLVGVVALGGAWWIGGRRTPMPETAPLRSRRRVRWIHESSSSEER
ncbi:MAG: hypothetical protein KatS3mg023_1738 [Armatimonadota bacterium]|nr:MAG: hypothetical protein KatS3mg023_1738 [Armatimonadota bacterium]